MASFLVASLFLLVSLTSGEDLIVGNEFTTRMSYRSVDLQGFWLFRRSTTVTFKYHYGTTIRGIACIDLTPDKSGKAYIVDGGIWDYYVQMGFVGARSASLRYTVEIFAEELDVVRAGGKRMRKHKLHPSYMFHLRPHKNLTHSVLEDLSHTRNQFW